MLTDEFSRPIYRFTVLSTQFFSEMETLKGHGEIIGGLYASVGELSKELRSVWENELGLQQFTADTSIPLQMAYYTPATLGPDRLATAIGGFSLYPDNHVLVLDFGTCLKCDFVSKEGKYEGGSISPGLNMRFKAMHTFTAKLPLLTMPEKFPQQPIGRSTEESMQNGVLFGMAAEADGMIRFYQEMYPDVKVLITGGDAEVFEGRFKNAIFVRQNLALLGLAETKKYHANTPNDK